MANTISHFLIGAPDREKAAEFYSQLLGWQMTRNEKGDYRIATPGKIGGHIVLSDVGVTGFFVRVDDIAETLRQVEALGGSTVAPVETTERGNLVAMFRDPQGTIIGLIERKQKDKGQ